MEKKLVTLVGGCHEGEILAVHPARNRIVLTRRHDEKNYEQGEWGTETSPAFVTHLVDFEIYERVDDETFKAAA